MAAPKVQYIRHLMGYEPTVVKAVVADNQTLVPGDLVCIASGLVTKASSSVHTLVFGICLDAITTTTHTAASKVNVMLLDEFCVIRLVDTGTNAVEANIWTTAYDIDDNQKLNFADTTNGFLIPVALPDAAVSGYTDVVVKASLLWNA